MTTEKTLKDVLIVTAEDGDACLKFPYEQFVVECDGWLRGAEKVAIFSDGDSIEIKPADEIEP